MGLYPTTIAIKCLFILTLLISITSGSEINKKKILKEKHQLAQQQISKDILSEMKNHILLKIFQYSCTCFIDLSDLSLVCKKFKTVYDDLEIWILEKLELLPNDPWFRKHVLTQMTIDQLMEIDKHLPNLSTHTLITNILTDPTRIIFAADGKLKWRIKSNREEDYLTLFDVKQFYARDDGMYVLHGSNSMISFFSFENYLENIDFKFGNMKSIFCLMNPSTMICMKNDGSLFVTQYGTLFESQDDKKLNQIPIPKDIQNKIRDQGDVKNIIPLNKNGLAIHFLDQSVMSWITHHGWFSSSLKRICSMQNVKQIIYQHGERIKEEKCDGIIALTQDGNIVQSTVFQDREEFKILFSKTEEKKAEHILGADNGWAAVARLSNGDLMFWRFRDLRRPVYGHLKGTIVEQGVDLISKIGRSIFVALKNDGRVVFWYTDGKQLYPGNFDHVLKLGFNSVKNIFPKGDYTLTLIFQDENVEPLDLTQQDLKFELF